MVVTTLVVVWTTQRLKSSLRRGFQKVRGRSPTLLQYPKSRFPYPSLMTTRYFGQSYQAQRGPPPAHRAGAVHRRPELPKIVHVPFLRSPHAHARIRSIDVTRAQGTRGSWPSIPRPTSATIGSRAAAGAAAANQGARLSSAHPGAAGEGQSAPCGRADRGRGGRQPLSRRGCRSAIAVDLEPLQAVVDIEKALARMHR